VKTATSALLVVETLAGKELQMQEQMKVTWR
jgi:hypothetical protein